MYDFFIHLFIGSGIGLLIWWLFKKNETLGITLNQKLTEVSSNLYHETTKLRQKIDGEIGAMKSYVDVQISLLPKPKSPRKTSLSSRKVGVRPKVKKLR